MKKVIALLLCLCALLGALGGSVSAAKKQPTKEEALRKAARRSYTASLAAAGRSSFHGYCGLMTSCQLRSLGINTWRVTNDGNKQFDYYSDLDVTSGGYYITSYPVAQYSLEEALNHLTRQGTRDVYNILVGFQWTNTAAGSRFGHAVFINGILDGTVYFVESYDCSLDRYYPEGSVITCSIREFAAYYEPWTTYEGVVWFGDGKPADACKRTGTDMMIQTRFETTLRSESAVVGQAGCVSLRKVSAGERFRVSEILEDPQGDRYYRVTEGGKTAYIAAAAAFTVRVNPEDLELLNLRIPEWIPTGQDGDIRGTVLAKNGSVGAVEVIITDSLGKTVVSARCEAEGYYCELDKLNGQLQMEQLPQGVYLVQVYGQCAQSVIAGNQLRTVTADIRLGGQMLQLGGNGHSGKAYPALQKKVEQAQDGWVWQQDSWYYYENGQPVTGWVKHYGSLYYLDETGGAVTGWQTVEGKLRLFSDAGAMITDTEVTRDGTVYVLAKDGTATEKK